MDESAINFYNMLVNRLVNSITDTLDNQLAHAYTKIIYNTAWLEDCYFMSPIVYVDQYQHSRDEIKQFVNDVNAKLRELYPTLKISKCEVKYKTTACRENKRSIFVDALHFNMIFETIKQQHQCVCS